jgi:hypothetical protein
MAFTPIDIPIQEILATDFITDIFQISNANSLQLKGTLEDLINNFEMDVTSRNISNVNNITVNNVVLNEGGFILQTGLANTVISKLEVVNTNQSKLTVNFIDVSNQLTAGTSNIGSLTVSQAANLATANVTGVTKLDGPIIESKQAVLVDVNTIVSNEGIGVLTLSSASTKNIYVKLKCDDTIGNVVFSNIAGFQVDRIRLRIEFDVNNPPAPNQVFKIFIADILNGDENSIVSTQPGINDNGVDIVLESGNNNNTGNPILWHSGRNGLSDQGNELKIAAATVLYEYGANVSLNYIVDDNNEDRLIITSKEVFDFYQI